jgi:hypothetical protein
LRASAIAIARLSASSVLIDGALIGACVVVVTITIIASFYTGLNFAITAGGNATVG